MAHPGASDDEQLRAFARYFRPDTIRAFANIVQSPERLKLLLLLTSADIMAVGPGVWNGWKGQLLRTLYHETEPLVAGRPYANSARRAYRAGSDRHCVSAPRLARAKSTISSRGTIRTIGSGPISRRKSCMRTSFAMPCAPDEIRDRDQNRFLYRDNRADGLCAEPCEALCRSLPERARRPEPTSPARTSRRRATASRSTRFCSIANSGRRGRASPRTAHFKHDRAAVEWQGAACPSLGKRRAAASGVEAFTVEPEVVINNALSDRLTVLEVSCRDRPGLLYELTSALSDLSLDIASAHVTTFGEKAVDVFYVTDLVGKQIANPVRQAAIRDRLKSIMDAGTTRRCHRKPRGASSLGLFDGGRSADRFDPCTQMRVADFPGEQACVLERTRYGACPMKLYKSFATVGGLTLLSRMFGFVRDILIAATLGSGWVADAFVVAFRFPNLFRRLFGEGAFNSAFVPIFAKKLEGDGHEQPRGFAEEAMAGLLFVLLIVTIVAELAMPFLMYGLAPGFDANAGKVRTLRAADADHDAVSVVYVARRADVGRLEFGRTFRRKRDGVDRAQWRHGGRDAHFVATWLQARAPKPAPFRRGRCLWRAFCSSPC